jgi:hypothetical protein
LGGVWRGGVVLCGGVCGGLGVVGCGVCCGGVGCLVVGCVWCGEGGLSFALEHSKVCTLCDFGHLQFNNSTINDLNKTQKNIIIIEL